jgi:hypothetical protein
MHVIHGDEQRFRARDDADPMAERLLEVRIRVLRRAVCVELSLPIFQKLWEKRGQSRQFGLRRFERQIRKRREDLKP